MLEWVQERAERDCLENVRTVQAELDGPGLEPASVDRAILVNVWHHIEDRATYGTSLFGSVRDGGHIFVVETKVDAPTGPPRHYRLPPEQVISELEAAGFRAELHPFEIDRQYVIVAYR